ncbi:hypothetical protein TH1_05350 [Thalassospira lucentensis MCCC 1A00383 = DSM 14000]|nr:hypothetical protein TH1_05350 [Thalassospira lucentensis MCCC 1A00383 = DSM 14000]
MLVRVVKVAENLALAVDVFPNAAENTAQKGCFVTKNAAPRRGAADVRWVDDGASLAINPVVAHVM